VLLNYIIGQEPIYQEKYEANEGSKQYKEEAGFGEHLDRMYLPREISFIPPRNGHLTFMLPLQPVVP